MEKGSSNATVSLQAGGRRSEAASRRARAERAMALAERLAGEMAAAWREGARPLAEEYLARHPEVGSSPETAARLIYEEICLREGIGQRSPWQEVMGRFPQWRPELEMLLDCHQLVAEHPPELDLPEPGERLGDYRLVAE